MKILNSYTKRSKKGDWYIIIRTDIPGHESIVFTLNNGNVFLLSLATHRHIFKSQTESENNFRLACQDQQGYEAFLKCVEELVPSPDCIKNEQPPPIQKKIMVKSFKRFVK